CSPGGSARPDRHRIIFFFQAEDGIRGYKVTGFRRVLFRSAPSCLRHGTKIEEDSSKISARADASSGPTITSSKSRPANLASSQQIGRASCRASVQQPGGTGQRRQNEGTSAARATSTHQRRR